MPNPRMVAGGIAVGSLVVGGAFMELLVGPGTDSQTQQYVETLGFALSIPAGLVVLAYLADEFDFDGYFQTRTGSAMVGDFLLSILGGAAVGLPATVLTMRLVGAGLLLFLVSGLAVFVAAFVAFAARTRSYFEFETE